jgi:hypothetical protein
MHEKPSNQTSNYHCLLGQLEVGEEYIQWLMTHKCPLNPPAIAKNRKHEQLQNGK